MYQELPHLDVLGFDQDTAYLRLSCCRNLAGSRDQFLVLRPRKRDPWRVFRALLGHRRDNIDHPVIQRLHQYLADHHALFLTCPPKLPSV